MGVIREVGRLMRARAFPIDPMEACSWGFTLALTLIVSPLAGLPPPTNVLRRLFGAEYYWLLAVMTVMLTLQTAAVVGLLSKRWRRATWASGAFAWCYVVVGAVISLPMPPTWLIYIPITVMNWWTYLRARARAEVG